MSTTYQARAEAEASMLLAKLAGDMEFAAIRLPVLWPIPSTPTTTPNNCAALRRAFASCRRS